MGYNFCPQWAPAKYECLSVAADCTSRKGKNFPLLSCKRDQSSRRRIPLAGRALSPHYSHPSPIFPWSFSLPGFYCWKILSSMGVHGAHGYPFVETVWLATFLFHFKGGQIWSYTWSGVGAAPCQSSICCKSSLRWSIWCQLGRQPCEWTWSCQSWQSSPVYHATQHWYSCTAWS